MISERKPKEMRNFKEHVVYFYGSTKITYSGNRNQIIGFEGVDKNPELIEMGERCLNSRNSEGLYPGETGTLFPEAAVTIVPFRYEWCTNNLQNHIIKHIEDVIQANEQFIRAERIAFPLMSLGEATQPGYNLLGGGADLPSLRESEQNFKNKWCCFRDYYLYYIKIALHNKGYSARNVVVGEKFGNLFNTIFTKAGNIEVKIHADAGM